MNIHLNGKGRFDASKLLRRSLAVRKRFLYSAGGFARKVARRSLRKARKIRVSELPDEARQEYQEAMEDFRNGYRDKPPKLGTIISDPGKPPLLHQNPSPIKNRLKFTVDGAATVATIGVERANDGIAGDLEYGRGKIKQARPFMGPALKTTLPKLPSFLAQAGAKG